MTIERLCAQSRGGLFLYDKDESRLQFGLRDEGYFLQIPHLLEPFEFAKALVAKFMCNPILYYRRAKCEEDKLEVMKYAVSSVISGQMNLYNLEQNETRLLKAHSEKDILDLVSLVSIGRYVNTIYNREAITGYLDRPQGEITIEDEERWHGLPESFPATRILEPQLLVELNRNSREEGFWIRRVSPAVDNVTDVISAPLRNAGWCSAMRLRVDAFEEHEDDVTGRVVSFRVATEEEELSLTYETSIRKRIFFD